TGFSIAWAICALGLTYAFASEIEAMVSKGTTAVPAVVGLICLFFAPIVFFHVMAQMVSRAHELRTIGQSMTEVALRFAEPESLARDSIVSVGQAIRREVAAMGDGVERALARAAELETLVNNEVAALERAYNDNEVRIRALIQSLAQQREALVGQSEQVRDAISNVQVDIAHDIAGVSDRVAERINESATRITTTLQDKGEHIKIGRASCRERGESWV